MSEEIKGKEITTTVKTEVQDIHSLIKQWYSEVNWLKFAILSIASMCISLASYSNEKSLKIIIFGLLASWGNFAWGFLTTGTKK